MMHNACFIGSIRELSGQPSYMYHMFIISISKTLFLQMFGHAAFIKQKNSIKA